MQRPFFSDAQSADPYGGKDDAATEEQSSKFLMLIPDQQIQQQPHRHMQVVHHRQRAAVDHARALVPPVHAQRGRDQAEEQQHAPLQRRFREEIGFAEHQECRQHHRQRAEVEEAETPIVR